VASLCSTARATAKGRTTRGHADVYSAGGTSAVGGRLAFGV